jgi:hypothetical protein
MQRVVARRKTARTPGAATVLSENGANELRAREQQREPDLDQRLGRIRSRRTDGLDTARKNAASETASFTSIGDVIDEQARLARSASRNRPSWPGRRRCR